MRPQTILVSFLAFAAPSVLSRPIWASWKHLPARATGTFVPTTDFSTFQISSGVAGKAQDEANAVFVEPFTGVDLSTIDSATVSALNVMRELAEDAETELFNPQIAAASGADAAALSVGKIKNKVLKLTGEVQVLKIKIAQGKAAGKDTSSDESSLTEEQGKLTKNIATDVKSAGKPSQAASGTVSPRSK